MYSDQIAPGHERYVIVREGTQYRLLTYATGGFPFLYWVYELPFVVYGVGLTKVAYDTARGARSIRVTALVSTLGATFHLLGPAFGFPLVGPMPFVGLGVTAGRDWESGW